MKISSFIAYHIALLFVIVGRIFLKVLLSPVVLIREAVLYLKKLLISILEITKFESVDYKNLETVKKVTISFSKITNLSTSVQKKIVKIGSFLKFTFLFTVGIIVSLSSFILNCVHALKDTLMSSFHKISDFLIYLFRRVHKVYLVILDGFLNVNVRYFISGFIFSLIIVLIYSGYIFISKLPSPKSIGVINFPLSTHIYDRNGKLLYEVYRDINRTPIHLDELPQSVVQATIAIEDKNFYNHRGISFFGGILRALKDTYKTNELQGGSTITQQLVKSALLTPERTLERKMKEIVLALWTEQLYSKNQILEMYLNQVPYGGSAYGIEEASKIYFGKSAKLLTLDESALLAGLPKAPSIYSPYVNPKLSIVRRNEVINQMLEQGHITLLEAKNALNKVTIVNPVRNNIRAPHFVFYTKSLVEKEFGSKQIEEGGFSITTTLDLNIQSEAEKILKEELEKLKYLNVSNGGLIILKPKTGEILAMVGSNDYFDEKYGAFNITTAKRQPGSTLKPMLYALALENNYTAATLIDDSPIVFNNPGSEPYRPINYDGKFHGRVTVRSALANSFNVPAIKVLNTLGVSNFINFAKTMGISSWSDSSRFGLSVALGGGEVSLIDLAQVYNVFASEGNRIEPNPIVSITDQGGKAIQGLVKAPYSVLDKRIAYIITDILSDNQARLQAFGPGSALEIPGYKVAVKTGTTNDKKDNLTVGYTPDYLVAVWVGNNDNTSMNQNLVSGITGAAPIFNRVMKYLLENNEQNLWYLKPENLVQKNCYAGGRFEYFLNQEQADNFCKSSNFKFDKDKNLITITPSP